MAATTVAARAPTAPVEPVRDRGAPSAASTLPGRVGWAWMLGLVIALVATATVWASPGSAFVGMPGDPAAYAWFLGWTPHALQHGLNPLETHLANAPYGANLMWNTWVPLAGLLLSPVTLLFGPIASYNVLVAGSLMLNAPAAFALTRRLTQDGRAALVGAACFGICPFVASQALGHPDFALAAYPPLALALLIDAARGRRSPARVGLLLGLATAAQVLMGEEVLAITAIGLWILGAWLVVTERASLRAWAAGLARALPVAAVVTLLLAGLPLAWQLLGPQRVPGAFYSSTVYSADLAGLLVATPASLVHEPLASVTSGWSGNLLESTAFVLPLVVAIVALRRWWWPSRAARAALVVACAGLALALGPTLHIGGVLTGVPGPARLLAHLPLVDKGLPVRLTLLADLGGAVVVGIALDRALRDPVRPLRSLPLAILLAGTAALWLPAWPLSHFAPQHVPGATAPSVLRAGDVVEFAPAPAVRPTAPMLWQAQSSFRWSMRSAYLMSPQVAAEARGHRRDFSCLDSVGIERRGGSFVPTPCPSDLGPRLRAAGVTVVVAAPSPMQRSLAGQITPALGRPERRGGLLLWRVAPPA